MDRAAVPVTGEDGRRRIARTDVLLADPRLVAAAGRLGRGVVKAAVVAAQQRARAGKIPPDAVADVAVGSLPVTASGLRPVINATGVLLHTNLGRAPLSDAAREAVAVASGATDVELDLETGRRAKRGRSVLAALVERVPQAEAAHVVSNGAAALVLAATALAPGREIVISRGEMVEIGDGFRIPELLAATGARLREVGTTNRTTPDDYAAAVGEETGFILKVHPSNFRIEGSRAVRTSPSWPGWGAGRRRHRLRAARARTAAAGRARRRVHAQGGRAPRHGQRRQASRRAAVRARPRAGRPGAAAGAASDRAGTPRRQDDPCRFGGDRPWAAHAYSTGFASRR